jgi:hypothetical protein
VFEEGASPTLNRVFAVYEGKHVAVLTLRYVKRAYWVVLRSLLREHGFRNFSLKYQFPDIERIPYLVQCIDDRCRGVVRFLESRGTSRQDISERMKLAEEVFYVPTSGEEGDLVVRGLTMDQAAVLAKTVAEMKGER